MANKIKKQRRSVLRGVADGGWRMAGVKPGASQLGQLGYCKFIGVVSNGE
jgi:hypothetical protein